MSIVGNRPLPIYEAELLTSDEYIQRFMAPAGTGLWQVEKRGNSGSMSAEERKQLDIKYAHTFFLAGRKDYIQDIHGVRAERGRIIQEFYEKDTYHAFIVLDIFYVSHRKEKYLFR